MAIRVTKQLAYIRKDGRKIVQYEEWEDDTLKNLSPEELAAISDKLASAEDNRRYKVIKPQ